MRVLQSCSERGADVWACGVRWLWNLDVFWYSLEMEETASWYPSRSLSSALYVSRSAAVAFDSEVMVRRNCLFSISSSLACKSDRYRGKGGSRLVRLQWFCPSFFFLTECKRAPSSS